MPNGMPTPGSGSVGLLPNLIFAVMYRYHAPAFALHLQW